MRRLRQRHLRAAPAPAVLHDGRAPAELEVDKWRLSGTVIELAGIVGTSPYPLDELLLMSAAFVYHRPEVVVEIGTHVGKSARVWAELRQAFSTSTEIHTIDLLDESHPEFPGHTLGEHVRGMDVTQHIGDGAVVAERLLAERRGKRTLLFLDGDHAYDTVMRELALVDLVDDGGILLHDTFFQPGSAYNHGPFEAIRDFTASRPPRQLVHAHLGLPGMSYLRY